MGRTIAKNGMHASVRTTIVRIDGYSPVRMSARTTAATVAQSAAVEVAQPIRERADSRRKRLRLIEAARIAVAEHGLDVSAADIAARAEVGVGTLYRRFGSKQALIVDVVVDSFNEVQAELDAALTDEDPGRAFAACMNALTHSLVINRGLSEIVRPEVKLVEPILTPLTRLRNACEALTLRAQQHDVIRADVTWRDILMFCYSAAIAVPFVGLVADDQQWQRTVVVLLDGLRSPRATPLPGEPPKDLVEPTAVDAQAADPREGQLLRTP
jgi:AcrR family transcriptional regulator